MRLWRVCCPDSYFGRNKSFGLDNQGERLTLALARLLTNMGEDANTFAMNTPTDYRLRY